MSLFQKQHLWGGVGKVCVHVFSHAYIFCILYNVFKVLSTALFLLDYYDDSIKIAIDLFTTTALPKSEFRFWMRNYQVTMLPEWYPVIL